MAAGTIAAITAVGTAAAGAGAIASSVVSGVNKQKDINYNTAIQGETMAFNAQEAEKARQYETEEWNRRFKVESDYNRPVNVVGRLAEIGFNPQSMYGDSGGAGQVFGLNSSPVPAQAQAPQAPYVNVGSDTMSSMLTALGEMLGNTAGAFKNTAEGHQLASTTTDIVKQLQLGNNAKALDIADKQLDLSIKQSTGMQKAYAELRLMYNESLLKAAMSNNYDQDTLLKKAQELFTKAQSDLKGRELDLFNDTYPYVVQASKRQLDLMSSEIARNIGQAAESNANASTINATREYVVKQLKTNIAESIANIDKINISTIETMVSTVDKTFGSDTGVGAMLKILLNQTEKDERQKAIEGLRDMLTKSRPKD